MATFSGDEKQSNPVKQKKNILIFFNTIWKLSIIRKCYNVYRELHFKYFKIKKIKLKFK